MGMGIKACVWTLVLCGTAVGRSDEVAPAAGAARAVPPALAETVPDPPIAAEPAATVVRSFVFVGCNRLDRHDIHKGVSKSTANLPQLKQTFADIQNSKQLLGLAQPPTHFFFCGDMVNNEERDLGQTLAQQLAAWTEEVDGFGLTGTILVPMPGNHEVLAWGNPETPNPGAYLSWDSWFTDPARDWDQYAGNGPRGPAGPGTNPDHLAGDNRNFTYSFTDGDVHFVIINTDTLTTSGTAGHAPVNWVHDDIQTAQGVSSVDYIFALGHKPTDDIVQGGTLETSFKAAPKFSGYLCAHKHLWEKKGTGVQPNTVLEVVAGNGGSKLESSWLNPSGGPWSADWYFGFTLVKIYDTGKVVAESWGRGVPAPPLHYYSPTGFGPTSLRDTVTLRN